MTPLKRYRFGVSVSNVTERRLLPETKTISHSTMDLPAETRAGGPASLFRPGMGDV